MKIYLACPYSDDSAEVRLARFHLANEYAARLIRGGNIVFSPISHSHSIAIQNDQPLGYDFWRAQDDAFIEWCDVVYVLPLDGWEDSVGVQGEILLAEELGKAVVIMDTE